MEKRKEYYDVLQVIHQIPFSEIQNDMKKTLIILNTVKNKSDCIGYLKQNLFLVYFRNIKILEQQKQEFKLQTNDNIFSITVGLYTVYFDIDYLISLLSKTIPYYINYQISINDQIVITNGKKGKVSSTEVTNIHSHKFVIELFIDDEYLTRNTKRFLYLQILENILIIIPTIVISLIFFILFIGSIINELKITKSSHKKSLEEKKLLFD